MLADLGIQLDLVTDGAGYPKRRISVYNVRNNFTPLLVGSNHGDLAPEISFKRRIEQQVDNPQPGAEQSGYGKTEPIDHHFRLVKDIWCAALV